MNKRIKTFSILAVIALFATACGAQTVQAQPAEQFPPKAVTYEAVLNKSITTKDSVDFIASNNCTPSGQFQLCQSIGLALWADADQTIKTAYLYLSKADDFATYKGYLPFGLASNDTMASVEHKFGHPKVEQAVVAGWELGLPDTGGTPDYMHYWAIYKRFGITIVYNSPSAEDKSATIHAILVSK